MADLPERSCKFDVIIVGAGHAGTQAAIALRQANFAGSIALLSNEPDAPYERPPLSKEYFSGEKSFERILIRPPDFWSKRDIVLMLDAQVNQLDEASRSVTTESGTVLHYRSLVWAAGGAPRRMRCPGSDLVGVHYVRTRADCDAIRAELALIQSVAIIGGGYIGLEMAAALTKKGKQVILIEACDRVLSRVAGPVLSAFFQSEHRQRGVAIRLNSHVTALCGKDGRVTSVSLATGETIAADLVIVGIGIVPEVGVLTSAGAAGSNGVLVDDQCRTSLADVYAIGDCAAHVNAFAGGATIRLESVQNACDQATVAAKTIAGQAVAYDALPWFWSNQYDVRLQTVGLSSGFDQTAVRGNPSTKRFSIVYLKNNRIIALDCVNMVKDFSEGRKLVARRSDVHDIARLSDPSIPLKEFAV
jgi:3-phenylpropionate/trans-cinnamate dioxygenase ferredoxin reductase component